MVHVQFVPALDLFDAELPPEALEVVAVVGGGGGRTIPNAILSSRVGGGEDYT